MLRMDGEDVPAVASTRSVSVAALPPTQSASVEVSRSIHSLA